ncbi:MAG: glycosyltransferase [Candidatus Binataceae bacterium]|jgi:glycosyltransferase involved in cell wall biosynthesis
MPTVSVVIPTFNRAHVVGQAIESVLAQTLTDFELILVDDGSSDNTAEIVKNFVDPRVRYVRQSNAGAGLARNRGVDESSADLAAFLDSDDLWMPQKLAASVACAKAHPEVTAVFHDLEWQHGDEVKPSLIRAFSPTMRRWLAAQNGSAEGVLTPREIYLMLLEEVPIKPTALIVNKAAFQNCGGFGPVAMAEDWEFLLRFCKRNEFAYVDQPLAVIRVSAESIHVSHVAENIADVYRMLENEKILADPKDRGAFAAINRGIVSETREAHRRFLEQGRRWDAARLCLTGFSKTRSLELLMRAMAVFAPEPALSLARASRRSIKADN